MGLLTKSVFKIEPFYKVLKNGHCFVILSQLCRKNLLDFSEQVLCQQTQHGQKSIGFGGTPTSIFAERKSQVSIHLPCLPLTRSPGNPYKKRRRRFSYAPSVSRALRIPSAAPLHDDKLFFVHAVQHTVKVFSAFVLSVVPVRVEKFPKG